MPFDSRKTTLAHIGVVRDLLWKVCYRLQERAGQHDRSKLSEPEKSLLDALGAQSRSVRFGSPRYEAFRAEQRVLLEEHYRKNAHHPEHYDQGIAGMSLLDLIEMICDWEAATKRHADGDIRESLRVNRERFGIDPQLESVLLNTIEEMGW